VVINRQANVPGSSGLNRQSLRSYCLQEVRSPLSKIVLVTAAWTLQPRLNLPCALSSRSQVQSISDKKTKPKHNSDSIDHSYLRHDVIDQYTLQGEW